MNNTKPNIILIFTDQWRGDCLGVAGHSVVETPHLDMLARRGTIFSRAYSACPSCIAARACLMTGQTPSTVGRMGYRDAVPWRYETTVATELADAGYQCHLVGKTHFYPQRVHLGFHSMETYECLQNHDKDYINDYFTWLKLHGGALADETQTGLHSNSWVARPSSLPEHLHVNSWTMTRSMDFLQRRDPTRPFFLKISFHRPHPPFDPPSEYFHMYDNKPLEKPPMGDWASENFHEVDDVSAWSGVLGQAESDRQRRAYYGQMTHIDSQIGRLLQYLQRTGLNKNTVIMFTSDHGEMLGDHGMLRKSTSLEGSAKIPLIVHAPPSFGYKQNQLCDLPVSHMDIMPTFLDIAGRKIPDSVEGESMLNILCGNQSGAEWREYLHGEHTNANAAHGGVQFMVDRREKYSWFTGDGLELLFDLCEDPQELCNLAGRRKFTKNLQLWRDRMVAELAKRPQDGLSDGEKLISGKNISAVRKELMQPYYDNDGRPRPAGEVSPFADGGEDSFNNAFWIRN